jgi:hypothetical protein
MLKPSPASPARWSAATSPGPQAPHLGDGLLLVFVGDEIAVRAQLEAERAPAAALSDRPSPVRCARGCGRARPQRTPLRWSAARIPHGVQPSTNRREIDRAGWFFRHAKKTGPRKPEETLRNLTQSYANFGPQQSNLRLKCPRLREGPFWENCEIFLCAPGPCARASSRGVVRGLGQLNMAASASTSHSIAGMRSSRSDYG